jgi:hypothetical protein
MKPLVKYVIPADDIIAKILEFKVRSVNVERIYIFIIRKFQETFLQQKIYKRMCFAAIKSYML